MPNLAFVDYYVVHLAFWKAILLLVELYIYIYIYMSLFVLSLE